MSVPMYRDPACPTHGDARLAELDRPEVHQALADRLLELRVLIDDIRKFKVSSYSTSPVGTSFAVSPGVDDVSLVERVERAAQDEEEGERIADNDHDGLG